ncbi:MAG: ribonuclease Y [Limnochordaceae bacterium]|nr:ribonuclease Y [Limnochordaceae bacterium]
MVVTGFPTAECCTRLFCVVVWREVEYIQVLGIILLTLVIAAVSGVAGFWLRARVYEAKIGTAEEQAAQIRRLAEEEAEARRREAALQVKEQEQRLRERLEQETRQRRAELQQLERRLDQREDGLDRRLEQLERKEESLQKKDSELEEARRELQALQEKAREELAKVAALTPEQAREIILKQAEEEARHDAAVLVRDLENEARAEGERRAREIIATAIQRYAAEHVAESTVSVVNLPSDEMKGRIIGREGRNIRTFEQLTGVDLIIDDTPEAVIVSAFDPIRREVARMALERLVADGRIHPARIEEMVAKARRDVEQRIREEGENAALEAGVHGLHPELIKILGKLRFRTSYGQNVLSHSLEVCHLAGMMAAELGVDEKVARRAGLLHDIGKAVDHDVEGTHVQIGMELLRRYHESESVIHAMSCHHGEFEPHSVEAVLVTAADALSAARPGARRETLELYVKRLEKLEAIADSFAGVEKAFAIQAGREVRIMVKPDRVDDAQAAQIARDISKRIEKELEYPGQIKVTVIRETRAVEYAK